MKNILTVDVEDWYCDLPIGKWNNYEDRVVQATKKVLKIIKDTNNKATFFILGFVAEKYPTLVKDNRRKSIRIPSPPVHHSRTDFLHNKHP